MKFHHMTMLSLKGSPPTKSTRAVEHSGIRDAELGLADASVCEVYGLDGDAFDLDCAGVD